MGNTHIRQSLKRFSHMSPADKANPHLTQTKVSIIFPTPPPPCWQHSQPRTLALVVAAIVALLGGDAALGATHLGRVGSVWCVAGVGTW